MKTLLEIQDEVDNKRGFKSIDYVLSNSSNYLVFDITKEAAEIYAEQFKPRWISVDERLPEDGMEVLVFGENYFDVPIQAFLYMGYWKGSLEVTDQMNDCYRVDPFLTSQKHITHWMPLPEKP